MEIKRCPKCGNLNVSIDFENNHLICNRCDYNGEKKASNTYKELIDEFEHNQSASNKEI